MGTNIAALVLAAGGSTRMGAPKQLLPYCGRSLLRHAAEAAAASECRPVLVVLGAYADRLKRELTGLRVRVVVNEAWDRGVGASLRAGLEALLLDADPVEAAVVLLGDQPLVGPDVVARLVEAHRRTGKPIVASDYEGTRGAPALFARRTFPRLLRLADGEGAKRVIAEFGEDVWPLPFPGGAVDIDTPQDYARLRQGEGAPPRSALEPR